MCTGHNSYKLNEDDYSVETLGSGSFGDVTLLIPYDEYENEVVKTSININERNGIKRDDIL